MLIQLKEDPNFMKTKKPFLLKTKITWVIKTLKSTIIENPGSIFYVNRFLNYMVLYDVTLLNIAVSGILWGIPGGSLLTDFLRYIQDEMAKRKFRFFY